MHFCLWAILKPFLYAYCILYVFSDRSLCSFYHLGYYRCFLGDKLKWKTCCSPLNFFLPICILKLISKELKHCYLYKIWSQNSSGIEGRVINKRHFTKYVNYDFTNLPPFFSFDFTVDVWPSLSPWVYLSLTNDQKLCSIAVLWHDFVLFTCISDWEEELARKVKTQGHKVNGYKWANIKPGQFWEF